MSKKAVLEELGIQDGPWWQILRILLGVVCPAAIFVLFVVNLGVVKLATGE
jgi:hypothetical protein